MSLSIEELLRPRYKVIADWPENTFDIGQILVLSDRVEDWLQTDNFLHGFKLSGVEKYPHLFRKLDWAEDREPEDMPKYVKRVGGPHKSKDVLRVLNPMHNGREFGHEEGAIEHRFIYPSAAGYLPATLEEYNAFKSGKS